MTESPPLSLGCGGGGGGGRQNNPLNSSSTEQPTSIAPGDNYSYVQLTAVHDYNYPVVDEPVSAIVMATTARRESTCSLKKRGALDMNMPGSMGGGVHHNKDPHLLKNRLRCRFVFLSIFCPTIFYCIFFTPPRYCQEFYTEEWNRKGACEFAPDCFKNGLEQISGMMCARCMLYHCMSDAEGETPQNPCECVFENGCTRRFVANKYGQKIAIIKNYIFLDGSVWRCCHCWYHVYGAIHRYVHVIGLASRVAYVAENINPKYDNYTIKLVQTTVLLVMVLVEAAPPAAIRSIKNISLNGESAVIPTTYRPPSPRTKPTNNSQQPNLTDTKITVIS